MTLFLFGVIIGLVNGLALGGIVYRELILNRNTGHPGGVARSLKAVFVKERAKMFDAPLDADLVIQEQVRQNEAHGLDTKLEDIL